MRADGCGSDHPSLDIGHGAVDPGEFLKALEDLREERARLYTRGSVSSVDGVDEAPGLVRLVASQSARAVDVFDAAELADRFTLDERTIAVGLQRVEEMRAVIARNRAAQELAS